MGYREIKSCQGGKKGGVEKVFSGKSAMKWISKISTWYMIETDLN